MAHLWVKVCLPASSDHGTNFVLPPAARWNYAKSGGDPMKLDFNMTKLKNKRVGIIGTASPRLRALLQGSAG